MLYNTFGIVFKKPSSPEKVNKENPLRDFFSSYTKYVIEISGSTYNLVGYTEPNSSNTITLNVSGQPFTGSTYSESFLIRPNNGTIEEFHNGLDDLEELLLDRQSNPKYEGKFKVPKDSFDGSSTDIVTVEINWPISKDNWNPQIVGLDYEEYLTKINSLAEEIDNYKSNLILRFLTSGQLFEYDTLEKKGETIFQLYGQSFDKVKKYIDNIPLMRNVTYDGINNLPDILLKNLANTLGLDTVNLFDENNLEQSLYTRHQSNYSGITTSFNVVDARI